MPGRADIDRTLSRQGTPIDLGDGRLKAAQSGDSGNCVSWRFADGGVHISHSARPGEEITFTLAEWTAFLAGATEGQADPPA